MSIRPMFVLLGIMVAAAAAFAIDVRVNDVSKSPLGYTAEPHYASLTISDATGLDITDPSTATAIAGAAPLAVGLSNGMTSAIATGLLTAVRAGVYDCRANISQSTAVGGATSTLQLLKNSTAQGAASVFTESSDSALVIIPTQSVRTLVSLVAGDTVSATIKMSAGHSIIKSYEMACVQLTDAGTI